MSDRTVTGTGTAILQSYLDTLLDEIPGTVPSLPVAQTSARDTRTGGATDALHEFTGDSQRLAGANRPEDWRAKPFQALLFHVHSVQLAAPLIRLYGVVPWNNQVSDLPNTPDWFLGLFPYRDHNVRVVDTAKLLLRGQNIDVERKPRHILLLHEGRWGMTCDGLSDVLTIDPESVKWRAGTGQRSWLAGTVREKLCAMVDVDAFAGMLENHAA